MQIPVMAKDVFICRLIVSPAVAVKPHSQPNATTLPPPSEAAKIFLNVSEGERWGHQIQAAGRHDFDPFDHHLQRLTGET